MFGTLLLTCPSAMHTAIVLPCAWSRRLTAAHVAENCATVARGCPHVWLFLGSGNRPSKSSVIPLRLCCSTISSISSAKASRRSNAAGGSGPPLKDSMTVLPCASSLA